MIFQDAIFSLIFNHVYVTTSGRFSKPLLNYVIEVMGEDSILLATGYPYEDLKQSMDFIRESTLSETTLKKICYQNALELGIPVPEKYNQDWNKE